MRTRLLFSRLARSLVLPSLSLSEALSLSLNHYHSQLTLLLIGGRPGPPESSLRLVAVLPCCCSEPAARGAKEKVGEEEEFRRCRSRFDDDLRAWRLFRVSVVIRESLVRFLVSDRAHAGDTASEIEREKRRRRTRSAGWGKDG